MGVRSEEIVNKIRHTGPRDRKALALVDALSKRGWWKTYVGTQCVIQPQPHSGCRLLVGNKDVRAELRDPFDGTWVLHSDAMLYGWYMRAMERGATDDELLLNKLD